MTSYLWTRCVALAMLAVVSSTALATSSLPAGSEFNVNTYTTFYQLRPVVSADADGDFVVVWQSLDQDGSGFGVFGQRYSSAGTAQGTEFQVNTYTFSRQYFAAVSADADGDFVVVWDSNFQDGFNRGIFGQRYSSAGAAQGTEFQVNTYTPYGQSLPDVSVDADGDFVVVWLSQSAIFGQRYSSAGAAQGTEFQVNTYTAGLQFQAAVSTDADGDFVVVWDGYQDGNGVGIFAQRYNSAGAAEGTEFQVNTYTTNLQAFPDVSADADGDFVVVWTSYYGQDGDNFGVFGQRYSSAGTAQGTEFQVNTFTTGGQGADYNFRPGLRVTADADGDFVVVWDSNFQDGSNFGIFGQRYSSAGTAQGTEFQVNTYTTLAQYAPVVSADPDGDFVVVWDSIEDGSARGIFGQRYQICGNGAVGSIEQCDDGDTTGGDCCDAMCQNEPDGNSCPGGGTCSGGICVGEPNEHYACYQAKAEAGLKPDPKPSGTLTDEVATGNFEKCKFKLLCAPTEKNDSGPPANPDLFYCGWQCKGFKGAVPFTVTDQFGAGEVVAKKLKFILNECSISP